MNKEDIKLLIGVGFVCIGIGFLLGVSIAMIPEDKCIKNPLYYGVSVYGNYSCNCYSNQGWENPSFFFNKTGVFAIK